MADEAQQFADEQAYSAERDAIADSELQGIMEIGQALGLDESLIQSVQSDGQMALIDRAQGVDESGAHGVLLSMVQMFGDYVAQTVYAGEELDSDGMLDVATQVGQDVGVEPVVAVELLGAVLETYQGAAQWLGQAHGGQEQGGAQATEPQGIQESGNGASGS